MRTVTRNRLRSSIRAALLVAMMGGVAMAPAVPAQAAPGATVAANTPILPSGGVLRAGQALTNAQYRFVFQSDGNAILTGNGRTLWNTRTAGLARGGRLEMGRDGIARIRNASGTIVWRTGTKTRAGATLNLSGNGALWTGVANVPALWSNGRPGSEALSPGGALRPGQYLLSRSGKARLVMQADGRLAQVGSKGGNVWSVKCAAGARLTMASDASLRVTNPNGVVCWRTPAMTGTTARLTIQDDDRLVRSTSTTRVQITSATAWNDYYMGPYAAAVFKQLNAERARHGLKPVGFSVRLHTAAHKHNLAMAKANKLSHQLPGEPFFGDRIKAAGYQYKAAAENISYTPDVSIAGAKGMQTRMYNEVAPNDGHRRNILDPKLVHVGVAVHHDTVNRKLWLTQDFGAPA